MIRSKLLIASIGTIGTIALIGAAAKPAASESRDRYAIAHQNVKQLLLLLDGDKNGRISKKEWMNFMEAEFNSLDKDGNGELDIKELQQSKLAVRQSSSSSTSR
jgi:Ca2+-binding EF-hand superfamily protein